MPSLPLFPLHTVLFPGGRLPLRIFEPRYVDMVRRCMRESMGFGVVLIQEGVEVGGPAALYSVGTLARIVDFDSLKEGLLGITAVGERRFRIADRHVQQDGLNIGMVEWLVDEKPVALSERDRSYVQLLEQLLPELGSLYADVEPRFDDAGWVAARLFEILPLPLPDKQLALELDTAAERFKMLRSLVRITTAVPDGPDPLSA